MSYINTQATINSFSEITENEEFPTFRDYCLYICGGDFTAFDDYNSLAIEMMNDDLKKGVPIC